jgi:hypothetical protein
MAVVVAAMAAITPAPTTNWSPLLFYYRQWS